MPRRLVAKLRCHNQAASNFFSLPLELRYLIYDHLLTAEYSVIRFGPIGVKNVFDYNGEFYEEWISSRLNVLRLCQRTRDEAIRILYKKGRFHLSNAFETLTDPYLGYEAVNWLQNVHFCLHPAAPANGRKQCWFIRDLGVFGDPNIVRGICHITTAWWKHDFDSMMIACPGLQTFINFQTLIIDSTKPSTIFSQSPMFMRRLEPTLGPGYVGESEGKPCLIFHPRQHRQERAKSESNMMYLTNKTVRRMASKIVDGWKFRKAAGYLH
jgi:hypothetical protein